MAPLKVQLYQLNRLILDHLPVIFNQLHEMAVEPFLYATSWFLTLFCSQYPLEFCNFVLDNVLVEGMTFVFKVALALFTVCQDEIAACDDFETTVVFLQKKLPQRDNTDVMRMTMAMTAVTNEALDDYAHEWVPFTSHFPNAAILRSVSPSLHLPCRPFCTVCWHA
jgi:TBC1 domain-containing protein 4